MGVTGELCDPDENIDGAFSLSLAPSLPPLQQITIAASL